MKQHYILPNADGSGIQIMEVVAQRILIADGVFPVRLKDGEPVVGWPGVPHPKYLVPFSNGDFTFDYPTVEECVAKWPADHPQPVNMKAKRQITQSDIPADRTFRAAWKDTGTKIDVDMAKARGIWRDKMREARAPKLASLDAAYMKADESSNAQLKRDIALQKQALRDVTADPAIEAAQTPEALKAVWPASLN